MGRDRRWGEEWRRELLAAFERNGLRLRAFAAQVGVPYTTMVHWRQRIGQEGRPRLLPVEVSRESVIEVRVGEATVRVEPGFDAEHLARVVRALRAC